MKIKNISILACMALAFVACGRDSYDGGSPAEQGKLNLTLTPSVEVGTDTRASLGLTLPAEGDFDLTLYDSSNSSVWGTAKLSTYDNSLTYNAGNYKAVAVYGSVAVEEFETPCYQGEYSYAITAPNGR